MRSGTSGALERVSIRAKRAISTADAISRAIV
jgi:hypothetical protein